MWGAQHIGQIEKGIFHAKCPMQERFGPPGIDANQKGRMALHMSVERLLIDNRTTSDIHQNGILFHPGQLLLPMSPRVALVRGNEITTTSLCRNTCSRSCSVPRKS